MKFRTRIWMLPLTAAAIFVAGTVASYAVASRTSAALEQLRNSEYPLKERVDHFQRYVEGFRSLVQAAAAEGDEGRLGDAKALAAKARDELAAIESLPERSAEAAPLREALAAYEPAALQAALSMMGKGDAGDSMERMASSVKLLDQRTADAVKRAGEGVAGAKQAVAAGVSRSLLVLAVTGLVTLGALGLASALLVRSVWRDLGEEPALLRLLVQRIADGDLAAVGPQPGDSLRASLGRMAGRLRETVGGIRGGADAINNASGEITSGSQDLSERTERTAARLQQTASAMEQMTSNVQHTASAAVQAGELARDASDSAERGGTIVNDVVANMSQITDASGKITEIIGVIDGIAFQTNILALNAAVEAARAGEQGRGFAVVAAEVRTLAQRSAQAAKQIKELITVSSERVSEGARRVRDAGAAMDEIVTHVRRVADIIGEITVASREQSEGIADVNASISELDGMTQQNAALVEQSAAAASSLSSQATQLADAVRTFRLESATT
jgi:methyl-accepting chemotaxis protein